VTGSAAPAPPVGARSTLKRDHDFRLLWCGETTSTLGTAVSQVALPLVAVVSLQASTFQVGLLTAATWVPWLLVGLPAGAWVDRLPRRPLMLACYGASAVLLLSVPLAAWVGALTLAHLLVAAVLTGAASVFAETAQQVYVAGIVADRDLPEANASLQGSQAAAQVAGPGLAGLLAQSVGAVVGLAADALSFLVAAACLLRVRAEEDARPASCPSGGLAAQIADGLRFLVGDPYLRVFAVFGALSNLGLIGYQAILVVFLVREVGVSPGAIGLLISGMSVGGIGGAAVAPALTRRLGTARGMLTIELGAVPLGLLIPLAAPGPRLGLVVLGGVAVGVGIVGGNVVKSSFRQAYCPRALLGRVTVGMQFLNYGTIPLGAVLGGLLGSTLGLRPTMWIMLGGVALALLVLLIGPIKQHRDLPSAPAA